MNFNTHTHTIKHLNINNIFEMQITNLYKKKIYIFKVK